MECLHRWSGCRWGGWACFLLISILLPVTHSQCRTSQDRANVVCDCSGQLLSTIPASVDDYITHLNLSNNPIINMTYKPTLVRFFNLKVLDLSITYISADSFVPEVFSEITTLQELYLRDTRLRDLRSPLLTDLSVKLLRLDHNHLRHLPSDFLVNVAGLEDLSLSSCKLESIDPNAFRSIALEGRGVLKRLDLSHNYLQTLSLELKPYIFSPYLLTIRLYDNFWSCDCHLKWLRESIQRTQASWYFTGYRVIPRCEEPFSLKHKTWHVATAEQYGCPPALPNPQANISAELGSNISLTCMVVTYSPPNLVEWTVDNITLEYRERFRAFQVYNGSVLTTTLTVTSLKHQDFSVYNCTVNTTFGSVTQLSYVNLPAKSAAIDQTSGVLTAAVVIGSILVVFVILAVLAYLLKKHFSYVGKLYMDENVSQKSDGDLSTQPDYDTATVTTPLNQTVTTTLDTECDEDRPDVIKFHKAEDLEMESLPVESEYPTDDAGCAEYNKFLEIASSSNDSPTFVEPVIHSPVNNRVISPVRYTQSPPTFQPSVSPNHSPVYQPPINHPHTYNRTNSPANQSTGYNGSVNSPIKQRTNFNGRVNSPSNPLVPYSVDAPTSQNSTNDVPVRMNTTPIDSPLTFIKEEQEPEEGNPELL